MSTKVRSHFVATGLHLVTNGTTSLYVVDQRTHWAIQDNTMATVERFPSYQEATRTAKLMLSA